MKSLLLFPLAAAGLTAQTFVEGRVFDSISGEPVANAYVAARGEATGDPMPTTDAAGHFRVEAQDKWAYLAVKHNGYLNYQKSFPIDPGQVAPEIRVMLVPQASISGRVTDENGLPVRGARVAAMYSHIVNGHRQLREWQGGVETNELGEYRIFGLPAGRYYLGFTPGRLADWDPRYNARLYPDATEKESAQAVDVKAGEEASGRDFRLSRREGATITGHMVRPDAAAAKKGAAGARVSLVFESTEYPDYLVSVKQPGDSFAIAHVPPGTYTLRTWRATLQPRIGDLMGDLTLQVGGADIPDVSLEIRPIVPQDIQGTIVFQGHTKPGPMAVRLQRSLGDSRSAVSNADGSFVVKGILPGEYFMDVSSVGGEGIAQTDGWVAAEQFGGRDVMGQMFDIGNDAGALKIRVAAPVAKVTGRLLDAAGQPISGGRVLFLSTDGIWSSGIAGDSGTFKASFQQAGEQRAYLLLPTDEWNNVMRDPDFLDAHRNDYPTVQIAEGENAPLVLRMKGR
jgi:hypothetical protein